MLVLTAGPGPVLREICAGLEEEGVPFEVCRCDPAPAVALAFAAAGRSPLDVGIGLDASGAIAVHHAKLPEDQPVLLTTTEPRHAGHDAARVVTRTPLTPREKRR